MSDAICIHGGLRRKCETCDLADRLEVAERIGDTFWDALKPLNLAAINVENPGQHVTDLITRVQALERTLADAKARWSADCAELQADRDFWDQKAREEYARGQALERESAELLAALKALRHFALGEAGGPECDDTCEPLCIFCQAQRAIDHAEGQP